jgi:DNA-binding beta-propeller fold protein YncE
VNKVGVITVVVLVAGCGSGIKLQPPSTAGSALAQLTSVVSPRAKVRSPRVTGTHAIKPDCCAYLKTLFVSDLGTNEVQMYEFPSNKYIGQVSPPPEGFGEPQGMCNDNQGNVFVANTAKSTIDEFSHNGAYVTALSDPGQYPAGCAFDKATGNLAVSNVISTTSAPGSVSIYTHARGTPKIIGAEGFLRVFFLAYAGKNGVLYLDGETASYEPAYGSLKNGSIKPIAITGASIGYAGGLSWSAKTQSMNIGDQQGAVLYRISPTGKIIGSMPLTGAGDIVQGTIKGPRFVGPDFSNGNVKVFSYPGGGKPHSTLTGLTQPIGSAISPNVP